ncbi:MAG TPA: hypothetical protein VNX25_01645 [Verrucomicrobiae bacterium]|nr:hypothetical protein [Verrucomicrobiae bacterium]
MVRIFETNSHGAQDAWSMTTAPCPRCGCQCTVEVPLTPGAARRALCWFCHYTEGYSFQETSPQAFCQL